MKDDWYEEHGYKKLEKLDPTDEWLNGAYDEEGGAVFCDLCGGELKFDPDTYDWYCRECEQRFDRAEYFNYIGAERDRPGCIKDCDGNYPLCKRWCERYSFDEDDPMLY